MPNMLRIFNKSLWGAAGFVIPAHSLITSGELTGMYCSHLSPESQQKQRKYQFTKKYDCLEMMLWTSLKITAASWVKHSNV